METFIEKGSCFDGLEMFCDGRLRTEDGFQFSVHRVTLSSRSDYFKALFGSSLYGAVQSDVLLRAVSGKVLRQVLGYLYSAKVDVNPANIGDLLAIADYLLVDGLVAECRSKLRRAITPENCVALLSLAYTLEHLDIYHICYRYVQTRFDSLVAHRLKIDELSFHTLVCLLTDNNLNVPDETVAWRVVVQWIAQNPAGRLQFVPMLLCCLRLNELDEGAIREVLDHAYVLENEHCSQLLCLIAQNDSGCLKDGFVEAAKVLSSTPLYLSARLPRKRYAFLKYRRFGADRLDGIKVYLTYDETIDRWSKVGKKLNFSPENIEAIGHQLIMFDPWEGEAHRLDLLTSAWLDVPPMNEDRREYSVVRCSNSIYTVGGVSGLTELVPRPTVERYDLENDHWTSVQPMPCPTQGHAVVVSHLIYTLGETYDVENSCYVMMTQVYDPSEDSWAELSAPLSYRRHFAMVGFRDGILIIGGNDDMFYLDTVERYDISEGEWTTFEKLPVKFYLPKAVVLNGVLVVYDNHSDDRDYYKTSPPVYWDESALKWRHVQPASFLNELHRTQFCAIDEATVNGRLRSAVASAQWSTPFGKGRL